MNPLDYAFVWQGEGAGWVILRSSWGGPILMHRPTASPLVLSPGVVNYQELVAVARAHGVPEVDVL
ncbi:hypothetical protein E7T06_12600 [Deinococcus sp. Arct2-2]|uniref:hypothetical protein n=1 Tax=Deinococcus sp. Arct2-2 TaxID=2568653 RepID=UPI0010A3AC65|nr:hypothetical protein [Deinococcus sp. Arct2-2]THF69322.1 hypothetical protein E7T06_12600 [Deinococcus sp. Arct2-2]